MACMGVIYMGVACTGLDSIGVTSMAVGLGRHECGHQCPSPL